MIPLRSRQPGMMFEPATIATVQTLLITHSLLTGIFTYSPLTIDYHVFLTRTFDTLLGRSGNSTTLRDLRVCNPKMYSWFIETHPTDSDGIFAVMQSIVVDLPEFESPHNNKNSYQLSYCQRQKTGDQSVTLDCQWQSHLFVRGAHPARGIDSMSRLHI